jgi:hypothetical protein
MSNVLRAVVFNIDNLVIVYVRATKGDVIAQTFNDVQLQRAGVSITYSQHDISTAKIRTRIQS